MVGCYNEINKYMHLSKLEHTVVAHTETKARKKQNIKNKVEKTKKHMTRWEDFRKRREIAIDNYIKAKKNR